MTAVTDARSLRLADGRDVRLAGIEAFAEKPGAADTQALATLLAGRDVRLDGEDDTPGRYGRQVAFVWRLPEEMLVQREILAQGAAMVAATVTDKDCAATLLAAEAEARDAKEASGPIRWS